MTSESESPISHVPSVTLPWERVEQFVGQFTHDIRNGLNALELQLTFLGEISTDPEAVEEIRLIRKTLGDVTRHLQAVRSATALPMLNRLQYPAVDFFEDLQERFARKETANQDKVEWKIDVGAAVLSIDPEATMLAVLELLGNALHFAGSGPAPFVLTASAAAGAVTVTLRETQPVAPTLSPSEWGHQPLFSARRGAYGLGLFRVRRIVEGQGGTYNVAYAAADHALTSRITLPTGRPS